MTGRLRTFLHWLWTGDGSRFFPPPPIIPPVVLDVHLPPTPPATLQILPPLVPAFRDALLLASMVKITSGIGAGGHHNFESDLANALKYFRKISEGLDALVEEPDAQAPSVPEVRKIFAQVVHNRLRNAQGDCLCGQCVEGRKDVR